MKKEKRWVEFTELRATEDDGKRKIGGYAAVFNKLSQVLWNFREKISPGAFARSIKENDVVALWSHNTDLVLGRTGNDTLSLREDDQGLEFDLELPDSPWGQNAYAAIKRGDVNGMSFGFTVREDNWKRGEEKDPHERTLLDVDLIEVSPTAFPAYKQTEVGTRSEELMKEQERKWAYEDKEQGEADKSVGQSLNIAKLRLAEAG